MWYEHLSGTPHFIYQEVELPCSVCLVWQEQEGEEGRFDSCTVKASFLKITSSESERNKNKIKDMLLSKKRKALQI